MGEIKIERIQDADCRPFFYNLQFYGFIMCVFLSAQVLFIKLRELLSEGNTCCVVGYVGQAVQSPLPQQLSRGRRQLRPPTAQQAFVVTVPVVEFIEHSKPVPSGPESKHS